MDGDGEQLSRMQGGVRSWVLHARQESGRTLRRLSPPTLLSLLSAAAFAPVITVAAGVTGAAVVAGIGVLSSVGGGVLGELISEVVDRLRPDDEDEVPSDKIEKAVAARIESVLKVGDSRTEALRAEIAEVLDRVDAGGVVLRAAIETSSEQVRHDIVTAISGLGHEFTEMRFLLAGIEQAATAVLQGLEEQDTKFRAIIELTAVRQWRPGSLVRWSRPWSRGAVLTEGTVLTGRAPCRAGPTGALIVGCCLLTRDTPTCSSGVKGWWPGLSASSLSG